VIGRVFKGEAFRRLSMQALLLLGLAVLISGTAMFLYDLSLPYIGFEIAGSVGVGAIDPEGPAAAAGLRMDDRLVEIGGGESPPAAYLHPQQESLQLTVLRDGQEVVLDVSLVPSPPRVVVNKIGYYLMALAYWAIAMTVLAFKPRDLVSQLFVLVALLGTFGIVVWRMADIGAFWANMTMPAIALAIGPVFVHYHTVFPERSGFRHTKTLLVGLYGASLLLLLLSTSSDLVYLYRQLHNLGAPSFATVIKLYFCACLIIGLAVLTRTYHESRSDTGRQQIALILLGTGLAAAPLMSFILLPQIVHTPYVVPSWISLLMLMFIPLSYVYAMYRHNLMKLDRIVNRSVVYFLLSLSLVGVYFALSLAVQRLMPETFSGRTIVISVVPILVLVFLLEPLKKKIAALVDRIWYGGWYEHDELVHRVSSELKNALDSQTVADLLVEDVAGTMQWGQVPSPAEQRV